MDVTPPPADAGDQLDVRAEDDGTLIVELRGEIDLGNADELGAEIDRHLGDDTRVVFELSGVEFMDTSGLALLLNVANRAASVSISDPSTQVRRVIESAGLGSILRMSP
jgi:anti-anti-sigma factor